MSTMQQKLEEIAHHVHRLSEEYPNETRAFLNFMHTAEAGKALSAKEKEIINVALSVAAQCEWCIAFHVKGALDAGASRNEIMESGFLAILMHGGPALMYLIPLLKALDEFTSA